MSEIGWLFVAFLGVWVGIGGYLYSLGARQRRLERTLDRLGAQSEERPSV
ncbi:MAG: CcmD family protein [Actinomycetota bacterium]